MKRKQAVTFPFFFFQKLEDALRAYLAKKQNPAFKLTGFATGATIKVSKLKKLSTASALHHWRMEYNIMIDGSMFHSAVPLDPLADLRTKKQTDGHNIL